MKLTTIIQGVALILCLSVGGVVWASPSLTDRATAAYDSELYNDALRLYHEAELKEGASSELYYNMGNAYYRLKDNAHAILYFERALRLDPANADARYNLEFVRTKAQIQDESKKNYLLTQIDRLVGLQSSNTWATIALVCFIALLLCVGIYLFVDNVPLRKVGFFGGIVMLLLWVVTLCGAVSMHGRTARSSTAIVTGADVLMSDSPRAVQAAKSLGKLQQGSKITITDSIRTDAELWYAIELQGRVQAWVNAKQVELI